MNAWKEIKGKVAARKCSAGAHYRNCQKRTEIINNAMNYIVSLAFGGLFEVAALAVLNG